MVRVKDVGRAELGALSYDLFARQNTKPTTAILLYLQPGANALATAKLVREKMEELKVRRLPVINKNKRMIGMLSLGDVGQAAPVELLSECVKSVSAHHA